MLRVGPAGACLLNAWQVPCDASPPPASPACPAAAQSQVEGGRTATRVKRWARVLERCTGGGTAEGLADGRCGAAWQEVLRRYCLLTRSATPVSDVSRAREGVGGPASCMHLMGTGASCLAAHHGWPLTLAPSPSPSHTLPPHTPHAQSLMARREWALVDDDLICVHAAVEIGRNSSEPCGEAHHAAHTVHVQCGVCVACARARATPALQPARQTLVGPLIAAC